MLMEYFRCYLGLQLDMRHWEEIFGAKLWFLFSGFVMFCFVLFCGTQSKILAFLLWINQIFLKCPICEKLRGEVVVLQKLFPQPSNFKLKPKEHLKIIIERRLRHCFWVSITTT